MPYFDEIKIRLVSDRVADRKKGCELINELLKIDAKIVVGEKRDWKTLFLSLLSLEEQVLNSRARIADVNRDLVINTIRAFYRHCSRYHADVLVVCMNKSLKHMIDILYREEISPLYKSNIVKILIEILQPRLFVAVDDFHLEKLLDFVCRSYAGKDNFFVILRKVFSCMYRDGSKDSAVWEKLIRIDFSSNAVAFLECVDSLLTHNNPEYSVFVVKYGCLILSNIQKAIMSPQDSALKIGLKTLSHVLKLIFKFDIFDLDNENIRDILKVLILLRDYLCCEEKLGSILLLCRKSPDFSFFYKCEQIVNVLGTLLCLGMFDELIPSRKRKIDDISMLETENESICDLCGILAMVDKLTKCVKQLSTDGSRKKSSKATTINIICGFCGCISGLLSNLPVKMFFYSDFPRSSRFDQVRLKIFAEYLESIIRFCKLSKLLDIDTRGEFYFDLLFLIQKTITFIESVFDMCKHELFNDAYFAGFISSLIDIIFQDKSDLEAYCLLSKKFSGSIDFLGWVMKFPLIDFDLKSRIASDFFQLERFHTFDADNSMFNLSLAQKCWNWKGDGVIIFGKMYNEFVELDSNAYSLCSCDSKWYLLIIWFSSFNRFLREDNLGCGSIIDSYRCTTLLWKSILNQSVHSMCSFDKTCDIIQDPNDKFSLELEKDIDRIYYGGKSCRNNRYEDCYLYTYTLKELASKNKANMKVNSCSAISILEIKSSFLVSLSKFIKIFGDCYCNNVSFSPQSKAELVESSKRDFGMGVCLASVASCICEFIHSRNEDRKYDSLLFNVVNDMLGLLEHLIQLLENFRSSLSKFSLGQLIDILVEIFKIIPLTKCNLASAINISERIRSSLSVRMEDVDLSQSDSSDNIVWNSQSVLEECIQENPSSFSVLSQRSELQFDISRCLVRKNVEDTFFLTIKYSRLLFCSQIQGHYNDNKMDIMLKKCLSIDSIQLNSEFVLNFALSMCELVPSSSLLTLSLDTMWDHELGFVGYIKIMSIIYKLVKFSSEIPNNLMPIVQFLLEDKIQEGLESSFSSVFWVCRVVRIDCLIAVVTRFGVDIFKNMGDLVREIIFASIWDSDSRVRMHVIQHFPFLLSLLNTKREVFLEMKIDFSSIYHLISDPTGLSYLDVNAMLWKIYTILISMSNILAHANELIDLVIKEFFALGNHSIVFQFITSNKSLKMAPIYAHLIHELGNILGNFDANALTFHYSLIINQTFLEYLADIDQSLQKRLVSEIRDKKLLLPGVSFSKLSFLSSKDSQRLCFPRQSVPFVYQIFVCYLDGRIEDFLRRQRDNNVDNVEKLISELLVLLLSDCSGEVFSDDIENSDRNEKRLRNLFNLVAKTIGVDLKYLVSKSCNNVLPWIILYRKFVLCQTPLTLQRLLHIISLFSNYLSSNDCFFLQIMIQIICNARLWTTCDRFDALKGLLPPLLETIMNKLAITSESISDNRWIYLEWEFYASLITLFRDLLIIDSSRDIKVISSYLSEVFLSLVSRRLSSDSLAYFKLLILVIPKNWKISCFSSYHEYKLVEAFSMSECLKTLLTLLTAVLNNVVISSSLFILCCDNFRQILREVPMKLEEYDPNITSLCSVIQAVSQRFPDDSLKKYCTLLLIEIFGLTGVPENNSFLNPILLNQYDFKNAIGLSEKKVVEILSNYMGTMVLFGNIYQCQESDEDSLLPVALLRMSKFLGQIRSECAKMLESMPSSLLLNIPVICNDQECSHNIITKFSFKLLAHCTPRQWLNESVKHMCNFFRKRNSKGISDSIAFSAVLMIDIWESVDSPMDFPSILTPLIVATFLRHLKQVDIDGSILEQGFEHVISQCNQSSFIMKLMTASLLYYWNEALMSRWTDVATFDSFDKKLLQFSLRLSMASNSIDSHHLLHLFEIGKESVSTNVFQECRSDSMIRILSKLHDPDAFFGLPGGLLDHHVFASRSMARGNYCNALYQFDLVDSNQNTFLQEVQFCAQNLGRAFESRIKEHRESKNWNGLQVQASAALSVWKEMNIADSSMITDFSVRLNDAITSSWSIGDKVSLTSCIVSSQKLVESLDVRDIQGKFHVDRWMVQTHFYNNEPRIVRDIFGHRCKLLGSLIRQGLINIPDACAIFGQLVDKRIDQSYQFHEYLKVFQNLLLPMTVKGDEIVFVNQFLAFQNVKFLFQKDVVSLFDSHILENTIQDMTNQANTINNSTPMKQSMNELLSQVHVFSGLWKNQLRSGGGHEILNAHFLSGVNHASTEKSKEGALKAYGDFHFQLWSKGKSKIDNEMWTKKTTHNEQRLAEITYFEKKLLSMNDKATASYQNTTKHLRTIKREYSDESNEISSFLQSISSNLLAAITTYSNILQRSGAPDVDMIFKVVKMWFSEFNVSQVNEIMKDIIDKNPSSLFAPLAYQIFARIGMVDVVQMNLKSGDRASSSQLSTNCFNDCVEGLVMKLCLDHPHHMLPHIFALCHENFLSNVEESVPNTNRRCDVSRRIVNKLQCSKMSPLVASYDAMLKSYIHLACQKMKPKLESNRDIPFNSLHGKNKTFDVDYKNLKEKIAVLTLPFPIHSNGNYTDIVKVSKFSSKFDIADSGISRPKFIKCLGTDGKVYQQIVKGNDDMRQDAVMQQVFQHVNLIFKRQFETRIRQLHIRTYKVVPTSPQTGILEFVHQGLSFLKCIVDEKKGTHSRHCPGDWSHFECRNALKAACDANSAKRMDAFQKIISRFRPSFRYFFLENCQDSYSWFNRSSKYIHSVAANSMLGYILGIGDRHAQNILVDQNTAEMIHIDFGMIFDQSKLLGMPERVPFRLTRDIVDGMGTFGYNGSFRRSSEEIMKVLRNHSLHILSILEVVMYDPLFRWTSSPKMKNIKNLRMEDEIIVLDDEEDNNNNNNSININDSSVEIDNSELMKPKVISKSNSAIGVLSSNPVPTNHVDAGIRIVAEQELTKIRNKLNGNEVISKENLSVVGQIEMLLYEAQSQENLANMFHGWSPWL